MELYRRSTLGTCLEATLDELVNQAAMTPLLAVKTLMHFDKAFEDALRDRVTTKATIKGHLHTYRYCDQVWTFVVENAVVKTDNQEEHVDKLKIVAIDAKFGQLASR